jgi:hypothetical protein
MDSRKYEQIKAYCFSKLQAEQAVVPDVPEGTPLTSSD